MNVRNTIAKKGGRPPKYRTAKELQRVIDMYFVGCELNRLKSDALSLDVYELGFKQITEGLNGKELAILSTMEDKWPTVTGLAYDIGLSRDSLIKYTQKDKFTDTIRAAKQRVLRHQDQKLHEGGNVSGTIFSMKNNYNWVDKQEVTGKDGKELPSAINISFGREESED